jgi:hypothetical protein
MCIYYQNPANEANSEHETEATPSETPSEASTAHSVLSTILSVFTPEWLAVDELPRAVRHDQTSTDRHRDYSGKGIKQSSNCGRNGEYVVDQR